jgi:hypothetical protein
VGVAAASEGGRPLALSGLHGTLHDLGLRETGTHTQPAKEEQQKQQQQKQQQQQQRTSSIITINRLIE